jgi:hypothetical protein
MTKVRTIQESMMMDEAGSAVYRRTVDGATGE